MEFKFKFTEKANQDLDEILGYISVELSNPKAASDFLENLLDIIENTCLFPESGSVLKNEFLPVKDIKKTG